jgi:hypothetical protein
MAPKLHCFDFMLPRRIQTPQKKLLDLRRAHGGEFSLCYQIVKAALEAAVILEALRSFERLGKAWRG